MKKICVIGHFGLGTNKVNGQTIKTKTVTEELNKVYGKSDISILDTFMWKKNPFGFLFSCINALRLYKNVLILPNLNGVKLLLPLFVLFNSFYKKNVHYIVTGGWLPQLLQQNKVLLFFAKRLDSIYVETKSMQKMLKDLKMDNVHYMPNFKNLDIQKKENIDINISYPLNLCTFSRVTLEKGIEDAINAVIEINKNGTYYTLDIYGQIEENYKSRFEDIINNAPSYIKYKGVVEYNKTTEALKKYSLLVFPTFYLGEGFAGTILDAFAAGLPVIATDWKYNKEIIEDGITGWTYKYTRENAVYNLVEKLSYLKDNTDKLINMKINSLIEAEKYSPERSIEILVENINKLESKMEM